MASPMVLSISRDHIQLPAGSSVTLSDQTWADYEALLASRRENAAIKICFNAHTRELRIMAVQT